MQVPCVGRQNADLVLDSAVDSDMVVTTVGYVVAGVKISSSGGVNESCSVTLGDDELRQRAGETRNDFRTSTIMSGPVLA